MDPHREFFEDLAATWDSDQPGNRMQHLDNLFRSVMPGFTDCQKVLIVGSGTGVLSPIFHNQYPGISIFSIDIALSMLRAHHDCDISDPVVQADVHDLPFMDKLFDGVICHNSFPHFSNHPKALKEMVRVLKPLRRLIIFHDINRESVNFVHREAKSNVIHHDILPEPGRLASLLEFCGIKKIKAKEADDYFLVYGNK